MNPELAFVIAHYHPKGHVPLHLYALLQRLSLLTSRIVFVSTGISDEQISRISPFAKIIRRENIGYDFWSYKIGIDALGDTRNLRKLVILNSSFITIDPRTICEIFKQNPLDGAMRGLTICGGAQHHAQSYCVSFEGNFLINSPLFKGWWQNMEPISERQRVIDQYEIGMSQRFLSHGVAVLGIFQPTWNDLLIAQSRGIDTRTWSIDCNTRNIIIDLEVARIMNPTHYLWDRLVEQFSVIKIEVLKKNPMGLNLRRFYNWMLQSEHLRLLIEDALNE